jgi:hypothetical protein
MRSVWVNENTWPTWSDPLTVGGGVSIENTSCARPRAVETVDAGFLPARHSTWLRVLRAQVFLAGAGERDPGSSAASTTKT